METDRNEFLAAATEAVIREINMQARMTLKTTRRLMEEIEKEAVRRDLKVASAVCTEAGTPVAAWAMDGSCLVSFRAAAKKAYTSAAMKMSTMELAKLAQPGGTFYGIDKIEDGIIILGGGVPLKKNGRVIGGLGVSGGTAEEDDSLAKYGQEVFERISAI